MSTANFSDMAVSPSIEQPSPPKSAIFADLEQFKVDMEQAGLQGAMEQLSAVEVRKPPNDDYIRVHPDKGMTIGVALHESKVNFTNQYYLILPKLLPIAMDLRAAFYAQLYVTVNRAGSVKLWPVKLPTGGASNPWFDSALRGVELAKSAWIRIFADVGQGQYRIMLAQSEFDEPAFPEKTLAELLEMAFSRHIIDTPDHPILRKLRGQV